jgi:type IV secretory pathway VirB6-like protein
MKSSQVKFDTQPKLFSSPLGIYGAIYAIAVFGLSAIGDFIYVYICVLVRIYIYMYIKYICVYLYTHLEYQ